jgi:dihydrodipicolinate synthase/N-acetylneuraminate lyase
VATAAAIGADAAVVVTPYYLATTQAGLRRFFERVAADSPLPLLLYNIPALTGNELTVETVAYLAALDGIVGLRTPPATWGTSTGSSRRPPRSSSCSRARPTAPVRR